MSVTVVEAQIVFCERCRRRLLLTPGQWEAIFAHSGDGEDRGAGTVFRVADIDGWRLYYDHGLVRMRACCAEHANLLPFPDDDRTYVHVPTGPLQ